MLSIDIYFRRHLLFAISTLLSCDALLHIQKFAIFVLFLWNFSSQACILRSTSSEHCEAFHRDGFNIHSTQFILVSIFTTANERKFSFFFLLSIFSNDSNARKSIVDRASQQGGNARTHPVDDEM